MKIASDDKDGKEAAAAAALAEKKPLQWKLLEPWEVKQKLETYEVRRMVQVRWPLTSSCVVPHGCRNDA